jgi:cell division septation protein DedD
MLLVVFFSLGVEKGRRIALKTGRAIIDRGVQKVIEKKTPAEEKKVETVAFKTDEIKETESIKTNKTTEEKTTEVSLKPYTIQVIAFKKEEYVKKETERLKNEGYDVFIIPSNEWIQVCVGKYANKEESKKDFDILKKKYPTCYIRKIEKER